MKEFKTIGNYYICEICSKKFENKRGLATHIQLKHDKLKYFLDYLFEEGDDKCKECGEETEFISAIRGYKNFCSIDHRHLFKQKIQKINNLKKYGVEHTWQRDDIKNKIKETHEINFKGIGFAVKELRDKVQKTKKERYGDENFVNFKKAKKTKKERYGDENYTNREKANITNLERYGSKSPLWGKDQIEKTRSTWLNKYGVENPQQNKEILEKGLKTKRLLKPFRDTLIKYQGSYELDFLEKFYDKIDIENGPSIKYLFENNNRTYHSDFYIPSKNLIVEIKSSYILKLDEEIEYKKQACIDQGYNYILILNKNYNKFEKTILI